MNKKGVFGILSGLALAAIGTFYFWSEKDPTFEEAKKDRTKRAAYVEAVEKKFNLDELPGVRDVRYNAVEVGKEIYSPLKGESAMKTILIGRMPGEEYDIEVYDGAFNPDFGEPESGLKDMQSLTTIS